MLGAVCDEDASPDQRGFCAGASVRQSYHPSAPPLEINANTARMPGDLRLANVRIPAVC